MNNIKEYSRAYYQLHKDKWITYKVNRKIRYPDYKKIHREECLRWEVNHPEYKEKKKNRMKEWGKVYRKEHKDAKIIYRENHIKEARAYGHIYRKEHRFQCNERNKEWRIKNPLRYKMLCHRRRSLLKDLSIKTVQSVYEDNIKKYGTLTCYLCLKPVLFKKDHLEHKIPLSRGGTNEYANLAIACQSCNLSKQARTEEEYRKERVII